MAKSTALEDKLAKLATLDLKSPDAATDLRAALKDKANLVIARAAHLAAKADFKALSDELEACFKRIMAQPAASDKGCMAKQALAQALYQFGTGSEEVFLTGIHHVQLEPAFGPPVDTAAELRGTCALGLVRLGHRDALPEIADLLADPEQQCRIMAARALAYSGRDEAALPLRVKILIGDKEIAVIGECLAALVKLTPAKAAPLLRKLMDSGDEDLVAEAAMTLGTLRNEQAFEILRIHWQQRMTVDARLMLLMPLALLRLPAAIDMLIEVMTSSPTELAAAAAEAMAMYRGDDAVRARIMEAAARRGGAVLAAATKAMSGRG